MAFFLHCYTVKDSISGRVPCDAFQMISGACQHGDCRPSLSFLSSGDRGDRADGFELGLGTTGPFYLTVKVLSLEVSSSRRLKPLLMVHQWYEMKNDNSNKSAQCALAVCVWMCAKLLSGFSQIKKYKGMHAFTVFQSVCVLTPVCFMAGCQPLFTHWSWLQLPL